jgi:hypothetical protein
MLSVFYPSRNHHDVSRFEEELLIDKDEMGDNKVRVRI